MTATRRTDKKKKKEKEPLTDRCTLHPDTRAQVHPPPELVRSYPRRGDRERFRQTRGQFTRTFAAHRVRGLCRPTAVRCRCIGGQISLSLSLEAVRVEKKGEKEAKNGRSTERQTDRGRRGRRDVGRQRERERKREERKERTRDVQDAKEG